MRVPLTVFRVSGSKKIQRIKREQHTSNDEEPIFVLRVAVRGDAALAISHAIRTAKIDVPDGWACDKVQIASVKPLLVIDVISMACLNLSEMEGPCQDSK